MTPWTQLIVAGSGEADAPQPSLFESRIRTTVRYADSAAWMIAAAVSAAFKGSEALLSEYRHEIGMVAISDDGPAATMAEVEAGATTGFSSPLRYAASSPGSLAGVSCIAFGLRGPTLNLTMSPDTGIPIALTMCAGWLTRKVARFMVVATFQATTSIPAISHAVLLAPPGFSGSGHPLTDSVTDWLAASRPAVGAAS